MSFQCRLETMPFRLFIVNYDTSPVPGNGIRVIQVVPSILVFVSLCGVWMMIFGRFSCLTVFALRLVLARTSNVICIVRAERWSSFVRLSLLGFATSSLPGSRKTHLYAFVANGCDVVVGRDAWILVAHVSDITNGRYRMAWTLTYKEVFVVMTDWLDCVG